MPHREGRRVLVTDGHATAALAAVRSLGRRGFRVTAASEVHRCNIAAQSRYASGAAPLPPCAENPSAFADALARELETNRYDLLIPITDAAVTVVDRDRARFARLTTLALPSSGVLRTALDKAATIDAARRAGIPVPRTWTFESLAALDEAADGLPYPCVIKPRVSRQIDARGQLSSTAIRYAGSPAALRRSYRDVHALNPNPLVQSFAAGTGVGVFVLADRGRPVATFVHRRLREVSPTGGAASLAESIAPDRRLVEPAHRLVGALDWHGVAMVEFKDPGGSAAPILMEVNGRLWGSLPLAIAAGVDFPLLLTQLFLNDALVPPAAYRVGVRCRHLRGDLSHLVGVLKGSPADWPTAFPRRAATLAAMVPWPGRWQPYNFRFTDPLPALADAWDFAATELHAIARRVGRKKQPVAALESR